MARKKTDTVKFKVKNEMTQVAHGDNVYQVKDGVVELPAGESWYRPLVESGELTPVE